MFLKHEARNRKRSSVTSSQLASPVATSAPEVTSGAAAGTARRASRRRRRALILSLAISAALPASIALLSPNHSPSVARAAEPQSAAVVLASSAAVANADAANSAELSADQQPMGNKDRLEKGIAEFTKKQYEEALADLQQVNAEMLGEPDRKQLTEYLARAEEATAGRRAARAEFEQGEQALAANQPAEAIAHYRNAANNRFADDGTKGKSREQIAVADSVMKQSGTTLKDLYASAVSDYKSGSYASAKTKFEQLNAAGYKAGLFQKSPSDYLKDLDTKVASNPAPAASANAEPANSPTPAPAPVANAAPAPAPAATETSMTSTQAAPAPAPTASTEAPAASPAPAPADASAAYKLARQQYRSGDWIAARRNFEIARDGGYKPGLFEDSPAKYLSRMDEKERKDAQLAAQQSQPAATATAAAPSETDTGAAAASTGNNAQSREEARNLVQQATAARDANRLQEALALYTRAADLDPSNTQAVTGRNELTRTLNATPGATDPLAAQEQRIQQQRQYINYTFNTAITDANNAIGENRFPDAQAAVERARVARNTNPGVFRDEEMRQFDTTIVQTQTALDSAKRAYEAQQASVARTNAAKTQEEQNRAIEKEREDTVRDLIRESRRLTQEGKFQEALGVIDQILKLDPKNDYAQGARPLVEDRAIVQEQRQYRESYDRNVVKQYNSAEEMKIPYSDILNFPPNWPDLSTLRDRTVSSERGDRAEDQAVAAQLDRKLPEVRFDNVGLSDVIDFLRDVSSANIFVNWRALEAAGIEKTAPVTARLRDVKFSKALDTILRDVGGGTVPLAYSIDEGVITISTAEDLSSNVVTRVYDIRDLIVDIPDFRGPDFQLQTTQTGGGGGGGQNLFGNGTNDDQNQTGTRTELVDSIVKLIQDTVASDSWKENGGTVGSVRELSGQLIVTQTPENQRQLVHLLEQLRETRAIQITVETRFLSVQRNFLEEIGVDVDVFVPNGQLFSQVGPINFSNNSSAYTTINNLNTSVPGNIAVELTSTASTGAVIPPNFEINNGTTGGAVTFLDDFQVSVLLRATQISQNTTTLTAPRITLFNGQRAFVNVSTETAYVSDLTPIVGTNAVAFDPTVGTVQSGAQLDVQATVSADRKYVTLTLRPTLQRLRSLVPFPVSALSAGGGTTGGPTVNQTAFLQQPVLDVAQVRTTVSVPDGGTLLLGGQTLAGEIEREAGVPVLSKIPFLKRLFTNQSTAKDEQVLLILVKPTIVIQREIEQQSFPLLSTKTGG